MRKLQFLPKNYYFIYNRGVDSRIIFNTQSDYDRFEAYLYVLNDTDPPRAANFFNGRRNKELFQSARAEQLVAIGSYCLLPREFYVIVSPLSENGVSSFMQKLQTAYTMYFNQKYSRSGSLFQGTFKALHLDNTSYFKYLFSLTHMAPAKLFRENWEDAPTHEQRYFVSSALEYRYSSSGEYTSGVHTITSPRHFPRFIQKSDNLDTLMHFWSEGRSKFSFPSI